MISDSHLNDVKDSFPQPLVASPHGFKKPCYPVATDQPTGLGVGVAKPQEGLPDSLHALNRHTDRTSQGGTSLIIQISCLHLRKQCRIIVGVALGNKRIINAST